VVKAGLFRGVAEEGPGVKMSSDSRIDLVRDGPRCAVRQAWMTPCDAPFRLSVTVK
jgi:hypothetical protein